MMAGYDPYDPYRDDHANDPNDPYLQPPPEAYGDPYGNMSDQPQAPPPWERPDWQGWQSGDEYGREYGGQHGAGGEPADAPPFMRATEPGQYGEASRYGSASNDPSVTQAYSPVDPSFGPPSGPGGGGPGGGDAPPPAFWDGLDAPPAPPRPDRREPPGGGYWDRIGQAPSAYASSPDREPVAGRPPSNQTETYAPTPPNPPGYPSYDRNEPVDSPYGGQSVDFPYGGEPVDSPYRDSPWGPGGSGYQEPVGYADNRYDSPGYESPGYDSPGYASASGYGNNAAYGDRALGNSAYADSRYVDPPYAASQDNNDGADSGYNDFADRGGYGGYADSGGYANDTEYGDYRDSPFADQPPEPRYAAEADSMRGYAMPFDAPEPTDTPPDAYGPGYRTGGHAGQPVDAFGEPTDVPPGGSPHGPGPGAAGAAGAAGAGMMAGAMPGSAPPGAMPGVTPDASPDAGPDVPEPPYGPPGRPPAGPYAPMSGRNDLDGPPGAMPPAADTDEFGDSGHHPSAYEEQPPVPRRVDLPDDVLAPLGTGGRRLLDEDGEPMSGRADARDPYGRDPYGRDEGPDRAGQRHSRTRDHDAARSEQDANNTPATVGIWAGVVVGLGLAATSALGVTVPSLVGGIGATVVAWMLTMVLVRRGFGLDWWVSGLAGVVPGALVLGSSFAPDWFRTGTVLYVAASAGAAAVVLTKPVRRLSELVLEYVVAVGVAFAGGGAVAGMLDGEPIGLGLPSLAIALGFGLTLTAAVRAQTRLASVSASGSDLLVYGGLVLAATVGAGSLAVLLGAGDGVLGSVAESVEDAILDFRLIVIVPLALLGSAVVVRAFTPVGWWFCAVAALSTTAMASSFAATNASGRADIAPTLASSFVGYVLGFLVTVGVAFLIGLRMRSASARRSRGGKPSRYVDEPGRLGVF